MHYDTLFESIFSKYLIRFSLIAVETVQAGTLTELVYGVELKKQADSQAFMNELRQLNANNKVVLITGFQEVDL
jgi:archaellum biogenesis ATPase FlaH